MTFHQPSIWFLTLAAVVPVLWWQWMRARRQRAVGYSSVATLAAMRPSFAARLAWLIPMLRTVVLVLLVVAVARPQRANELTRVRTNGVAISLVVDRSTSMRADDYLLDGRYLTRLDAVKRVVMEFIGGVGSELSGRPDDLVGVVAFGTYADSLCPLTLDHDHVGRAVSAIQIPSIESEGATAIGDALGLALERLEQTDARRAEQVDPERPESYRIKGKVIILLTDGANTAGDIHPLEAAELARALDVRIYTIGVGTPDGVIRQRRGFLGNMISQRAPIDTQTLRGIADRTGGKFYLATDGESLRQVYTEIDALERTEIETQRHTDYEELAVSSTTIGRWTIPSVMLVVTSLFLLELLLSTTRLRRML